MSEVIASEIWGELKRFVNTVDRAEAAETVIQILMDNDSDVEDIRDAFKGDTDIKRALTAYLDNDKDYAAEDEEEELHANSLTPSLRSGAWLYASNRPPRFTPTRFWLWIPCSSPFLRYGKGGLIFLR